MQGGAPVNDISIDRVMDTITKYALIFAAGYFGGHLVWAVLR